MASLRIDSDGGGRSHAWAGAAALILLTAAAPVQAQTAAKYFEDNCAGCHSIGDGALVGPDLKDITARRDAAWLARFLSDPQALLDSGDPMTKSLVEEAQGAVMPTFPDMTPARVQELIDFLAAASEQPAPTTPAAAPAGDRPVTPEDVAAGRAIFLGIQKLKGGGPACLSCHTVAGLSSLGGGHLGPDLTLVTERLQGRRGLSAWLGAPATPTMQSVYRPAPVQPDEILSLVAFLDESARAGKAAGSGAQFTFFMLGLGGAVFGLVVAHTVWRRRFRAVRRPMVQSDHVGVEG